MTIPDPTAEIKAIRHRLAASFEFDLDRIFADIQRRQSESGRTYVTIPSCKIADPNTTHQTGKAERTEVEKLSPPDNR